MQWACPFTRIRCCWTMCPIRPRVCPLPPSRRKPLLLQGRLENTVGMVGPAGLIYGIWSVHRGDHILSAIRPGQRHSPGDREGGFFGSPRTSVVRSEMRPSRPAPPTSCGVHRSRGCARSRVVQCCGRVLRAAGMAVSVRLLVCISGWPESSSGQSGGWCWCRPRVMRGTGLPPPSASGHRSAPVGGR